MDFTEPIGSCGPMEADDVKITIVLTPDLFRHAKLFGGVVEQMASCYDSTGIDPAFADRIERMNRFFDPIGNERDLLRLAKEAGLCNKEVCVWFGSIVVEEIHLILVRRRLATENAITLDKLFPCDLVEETTKRYENIVRTMQGSKKCPYHVCELSACGFPPCLQYFKMEELHLVIVMDALDRLSNHLLKQHHGKIPFRCVLDLYVTRLMLQCNNPAHPGRLHATFPPMICGCSECILRKCELESLATYCFAVDKLVKWFTLTISEVPFYYIVEQCKKFERSHDLYECLRRIRNSVSCRKHDKSLVATIDQILKTGSSS